MKIIEVLASGSKVLIGDDIEGTVLAITLRENNVVYEVSWFDGRIYRSAWLSSWEVRSKGDKGKVKIGFAGR